MKKGYARSRPLRLASKKRISYALRAIFFCFSVGYFVVAGALLSRLDIMKVSRFRISGNAGVPTERIQATVLDAVRDGHFHLFSQENAVFYPVNSIEKKLLADIRPLSSVKIDRLSLNTVSVTVVERVPVGLWCLGDQNLNNSDCYFFDHDGFIFVQAPVFSGDVYIRFWGGLDISDNPIGHNFTDVETFKEIQFFVNALKNEGIVVSDFEFNTDGDYTMSLVNGAKILTSQRVGMRESLENLLVFLDSGGEGGSKASLGDFEYVDLRFGSKIYHRPIGD